MEDNLKVYHDIISWVWKYFKKYYLDYDADASLQELRDYVDKFEDKRLHEFALQISKTAWKEVGQLHEMRKENEGLNQA